MAIALMLPYMHFKAGTVYMADRYLFMPVPIIVLTLLLTVDPRRVALGQIRRFALLVGLIWVALGLPQHLAWRNSVTLWSRMTEVYPTSDWGFRRLGLAWFAEGAISEAKLNWERAIAINAKDVRSMNNLGVLLIRRGDLSGARRWIEAVLRINPSDPIALSNLSIIVQHETTETRPGD